VLAAEAADLDVLWKFAGSIAGFAAIIADHSQLRGLPLWRAAVLGLVFLLHHYRSRKRAAAASQPSPKLPVRWGYLYFCAVLAALSHLLLDYTTAYGIRLFEPFNYRWYSWTSFTSSIR